LGEDLTGLDVIILKKYDYLLLLSLLLPEDFDLPPLPEFPEEREPPLLLLPDILAPEEDDCLEDRAETLLRSDCGLEPDLVIMVFPDRPPEPIFGADRVFEPYLPDIVFADRRVVISFCLDCGFETDLFVWLTDDCLFELRFRSDVIPELDLLVTVLGDWRVEASFCPDREFKPYLPSIVFAERRVVTPFCPDCGLVTCLFVTLFAERRFVPLSTDGLSEVDRLSDRLFMLLTEDPLAVLLSWSA
jgi:hypothetical protein